MFLRFCNRYLFRAKTIPIGVLADEMRETYLRSLFANTNTVPSDTVLKLFIRIIALRQYSASDHIDWVFISVLIMVSYEFHKKPKSCCCLGNIRSIEFTFSNWNELNPILSPRPNTWIKISSICLRIKSLSLMVVHPINLGFVYLEFTKCGNQFFKWTLQPQRIFI